MYELCNTMTENLQTARNALIVEYSQSIPSVQTSKFAAILDQQVQDMRRPILMIKYEGFIVDYEELRRLVMEMRSQICGLCAPSNWPHGLDDDQPHPPPLAPSLF
jgi:hypothetical protein